MKDTPEYTNTSATLRVFCNCPGIYEELLRVNKQKKDRKPPWENEQFTQRETRKADRYIKKFPKLLVIRWMYIKIQHHFTPNRLAKIRKLGSSKCWWGWGETGSFKWESQWPFWKQIEKLTCPTHTPVLGTSARELFTKYGRGHIKRCSCWGVGGTQVSTT